MLGEEQRASNCNGCGECDSQCPEGIKISAQMKTVAEYFDEYATGR